MGGFRRQRARKLNPLATALRSPQDAGLALDPSGKFGHLPVITYQSTQGDLHFALQSSRELPQQTARPRDVAVVIDTSASQAGRSLVNARLVLEEPEQSCSSGRPDQRLDGEHPGHDEEPDRRLPDAQGRQGRRRDQLLGPQGVRRRAPPDLKDGLRKVVRRFGPQASRQQVLLFLGDGESCLNPLTDADRSALAADMASREIAFFPVPLGSRLDPANLHGLASATGGTVVRMLGEESPAKFLPKLTAAFDAPIFYPTKASFSAEVTAAMPERLPPLRGDAPTLVAGLLTPGAKTVGVTAEGLLAGKKHTITISEPVPASEASNYFLVGVVHQWQSADKSAPALVRADRSLALAFEQTRLAKEEVLTQAHWALSQNPARRGRPPVRGCPQDRPARSRVSDRPQGRRQAEGRSDYPGTTPATAERPNSIGVRVSKGQSGAVQVVRQNLDVLANQQPPAALPPPEGVVPPPAAVPPPPAGADLLDLERRRRLVQEQQVKQIVDDTVARAAN